MYLWSTAELASIAVDSRADPSVSTFTKDIGNSNTVSAITVISAGTSLVGRIADTGDTMRVVIASRIGVDSTGLLLLLTASNIVAIGVKSVGSRVSRAIAIVITRLDTARLGTGSEFSVVESGNNEVKISGSSNIAGEEERVFHVLDQLTDGVFNGALSLPTKLES